MSDKTRRALLADEIGSANVIIVADAYQEGWNAARSAAREAILGARMPTTAEATTGWLSEPSRRLRWSWRAEEIVTAVNAEDPTHEEN